MAFFRDLLKKWFYTNSSSAASNDARIPLLTATGEPKGSDTMANIASVLGVDKTKTYKCDGQYRKPLFLARIRISECIASITLFSDWGDSPFYDFLVIGSNAVDIWGSVKHLHQSFINYYLVKDGDWINLYAEDTNIYSYALVVGNFYISTRSDVEIKREAVDSIPSGAIVASSSVVSSDYPSFYKNYADIVSLTSDVKHTMKVLQKTLVVPANGSNSELGLQNNPFIIIKADTQQFNGCIVLLCDHADFTVLGNYGGFDSRVTLSASAGSLVIQNKTDVQLALPIFTFVG